MLEEALLVPDQYMHVWGALFAILLTTLLAGFTVWRHEWLWSRSFTAALSEADLASSRLLVVCSWLTMRAFGCLSCFVTRMLGVKSSTLQRMNSTLGAAMSTMLESLAFWFDALWINDLWTSHDVRYQPYAISAAVIYSLGCATYLLVSLCLLFPLQSDHVNVKMIKQDKLLWSSIITASWTASPSLLTLLPWRSHGDGGKDGGDYGGFASLRALNAAYLTGSIFKTVLVALKVVYIVHLKADEDIVLLTLVFNIVVFLRSQLSRVLLVSVLHAKQTRWTRLSIFLSYRVTPDQPFVMQLYEKLKARNLRVWFDVECLKSGQPWEEGFVDGLFSATLFVPILSKAGLANFAKLDKTSKQDNVLIEQVLALEQRERGYIKGVFPVLLGSDDGHGQRANFFSEGARPNCADEVVQAVDENVRTHLLGKYGPGLAVPLLQDRTPCGVLKRLMDMQGDKIDGDCETALERVADKICEMAKEVAGGGHTVDEEGLFTCVGRLLTRAFTFVAMLCCLCRWAVARLTPSKQRIVNRCSRRVNGPHDKARRGSLQHFFARTKDERFSSEETIETGDHAVVINPILVHKARRMRGKEARAKGNSPRGALGKLNLHVETQLSKVELESKEVSRYMHAHMNVDDSSRSSRSPGPELSPANSSKISGQAATARMLQHDSHEQRQSACVSKLSAFRQFSRPHEVEQEESFRLSSLGVELSTVQEAPNEHQSAASSDLNDDAVGRPRRASTRV